MAIDIKIYVDEMRALYSREIPEFMDTLKTSHMSKKPNQEEMNHCK